MAKKYNKNKIEGNKYFRKLLFYTIFLTVILFSGINLFIDPIVDYFTKEYSQYVISILRILSLVLFLMFLQSNLY